MDLFVLFYLNYNNNFGFEKLLSLQLELYFFGMFSNPADDFLVIQQTQVKSSASLDYGEKARLQS